MQNKNGPCPLLAIANVLSLRNELKLPVGVRDITQASSTGQAAGAGDAAHACHRLLHGWHYTMYLKPCSTAAARLLEAYLLWRQHHGDQLQRTQRLLHSAACMCSSCTLPWLTPLLLPLLTLLLCCLNLLLLSYATVGPDHLHR
jgi:hypothetical protein